MKEIPLRCPCAGVEIDDWCREREPEGNWVCSLRPEHLGPHVACNDERGSMNPMNHMIVSWIDDTYIYDHREARGFR